ncbi:MAG: hypothetical protein J7M13_03510 [Synergistetes bacterium]|nr:hypothetical protein [Synergistota bacterium]
MSKMKIILLSVVIVLISFGIFTLLRFPYERVIDRKLKELEKSGVKVEYKELKVIPWKLRALFGNFSIKTGLFRLSADELQARLILGSLFKKPLKMELRLRDGSISALNMPGTIIPFEEGRGILIGAGKSFKISDVFLKGSNALIKGEIEGGGKYDLRVKLSGRIREKLSSFLRFLKKDREGFYILRSDIR